MMQQKISITGKSRSTLNSYSTHLAKLALHFGCLPTDLDPDQINDYLYLMQQEHHTPSDSYFKFTVYGLRFAFRMMGLKNRHIELPSIQREKTLPVVLGREEAKRLLKAPKLLKHRILTGLLYGCGLRCFEARNVRPADLGFDRRMLHVRKGKGKKAAGISKDMTVHTLRHAYATHLLEDGLDIIPIKDLLGHGCI